LSNITTGSASRLQEKPDGTVLRGGGFLCSRPAGECATYGRYSGGLSRSYRCGGCSIVVVKGVRRPFSHRCHRVRRLSGRAAGCGAWPG
jgi:hypothetical protein